MYKFIATLLTGLLPIGAWACPSASSHEYFFFDSPEDIEEHGSFLAKVEVISFDAPTYEVSTHIQTSGQKAKSYKLILPPHVELEVIEVLHGKLEETVFDSTLQLTSCTPEPRPQKGEIVFVSGHFLDGIPTLESYRLRSNWGLY